MGRTPGSRRPDITREPDAEFWREDLRMGQYDDVRSARVDPAAFRKRLAQRITGAAAMKVVASELGVRKPVSHKDLLDALAEEATLATHLLLVAEFAQFKRDAPIADVVDLALPEAVRAGIRSEAGRYDRLAALLHLYLDDRDWLRYVFGLNEWHRKGSVPMVLAGQSGAPFRPFAEFVRDPAEVEHAVWEARKRHPARRLTFEQVIPRDDGRFLLVARHEVRRDHLRRPDDGRLEHGYREDLLFLHFAVDGTAVDLVGEPTALVAAVADEVARACFRSRDCRYVPDRQRATDEAIQAFLRAATDPEDPRRVALVEVMVTSSPLPGHSRLLLTGEEPAAVIADVLHIEGTYGSLFEDLDAVEWVKVLHAGNRWRLTFPRPGDARLVQYMDGGVDKRKCRQFEAYLNEHFGLVARPSDKAAPGLPAGATA
ncbi:hypothetical protein L6R50_19915 [Myxococcota bacterium]|nr:hypothetical protein [Myxococcota bacterium]